MDTELKLLRNRAGWIPSVITIFLIAIIDIPTTLALTAHDKTEHSAKFLLDKMLEHRSKVRNLQYVVEEQTLYDQDPDDYSIKRMEDDLKRRIEEGAPVRSIRFSEGAIGQLKIGQLQNPKKNRYKIIKCTIDNEGRSKYEKYLGAWDSSGKIELNGNEYIKAWNGVQCIVYTQERGYSKATIQDTASSDGNPWRTLMIYLCQCLQESIEAKRDVSVEKLKDGTYRIAFDYKTRRIVAVIDPSKGYTCALHENHHNGQLSSRLTATYEEVVESIWFPVSGQLETFFGDSPNFKRSFKSSQIRINGPAFNTSYFDVDMPNGTTVTDEAHGKQYVVGSKHVHDLNEPQNSSAEIEKVDPNSWREKFHSMYRLEDGQVLKRIAPPFSPERRNNLLYGEPVRYYYYQYFKWDGNLTARGGRRGDRIPRLSDILRSVIGIGSREYDIPRDILYTDMSGDWIVRDGIPQEELLQALEQLIKEETGRNINFVEQKVETEVIIVRGKYHFTPLPNAKQKDSVQVFTDKMDTYYDVRVVRRTLSELLSSVERSIDMDIIDETESGDVELSWSEHYAMMLFTLIYNEQLYNERVDMLLNNLARQTGLTFERTKATVEKWLITEEGVDKSLL